MHLLQNNLGWFVGQWPRGSTEKSGEAGNSTAKPEELKQKEKSWKNSWMWPCCQCPVSHVQQRPHELPAPGVLTPPADIWRSCHFRGWALHSAGKFVAPTKFTAQPCSWRGIPRKFLDLFMRQSQSSIESAFVPLLILKMNKLRQ